MELSQLRRGYDENEAVRALCDHMAARERNQNETKLHRILRHLLSEGAAFKQSEVIAGFRLLEECGCGKYVEGRHGWPSRFVWEVKSLHVAGAARGERALEPETPAESASDAADDDVELLEHLFVLRPDVVVSLDLPVDLTKQEAARLLRSSERSRSKPRTEP